MKESDKANINIKKIGTELKLEKLEKEDEINNTKLMNNKDINSKTNNTIIYNKLLSDNDIMLYSRNILDSNDGNKLSKVDVGKINAMLKANFYETLQRNTTAKTTI